MCRRDRRTCTRRSGSAARADRVAPGAAAACAGTVRPRRRARRGSRPRRCGCTRSSSSPPSSERNTPAAVIADVHALRVARVELDRVQRHPACAGDPAVARRVLEEAQVRLPALAAVIRTEEHARIAPEIQRLGLLRPARLDVPRGIQQEPRLLRQADLRRPPPGSTPVGRALNRRAVDDMVRRGEDRAVAHIDDRVIDPPALEQRALDLPAEAMVIATKQEQPLAGADKCQDVDRRPT